MLRSCIRPLSHPWAPRHPDVALSCSVISQGRSSDVRRSFAASASRPVEGPIVPPFLRESAEAKVKLAENLWNGMDPKKVSLAYTPDSIWRNRDQFFQGRDAIEAFLTKKWQNETKYRLKKRLFAFTGNRIAVQFWYEYFNQAESSWKRTYGLEHWTFAQDGLMQKRQMSGNEISIEEEERWFRDGVDVDDVEIPERDG